MMCNVRVYVCVCAWAGFRFGERAGGVCGRAGGGGGRVGAAAGAAEEAGARLCGVAWCMCVCVCVRSCVYACVDGAWELFGKVWCERMCVYRLHHPS